MEKPLIILEKLHKSIEGHKVLDGVSLKVDAGEVVALMGPSGSGKSTLLRCLNGLEMPQGGRIELAGTLLTPVTLPLLRQRMGMVFQHFHLFPHLSVLDNVAYAPIQVRGIAKRQAHAQAMQLLQRVGMAGKAQAKPSKLSGGQKQRVAIARALAMEPEILLFDEPTSALDPEMAAEVLSVIQGLAHTGITLLIVTHQAAFAKKVADRVIFLDHGRILADQTATSFFRGPRCARIDQFLQALGPAPESPPPSNT